MAVACGVIVANIYYAQPLLDTIAKSLHASASLTSLVIAVTQATYAVGLFFVVPLGDILDKRKLITRLLYVTALASFLAAASPNLTVFMIACSLIGVSAVSAQVIVPFASILAAKGERGKVVGIVMSGLLLGILLARTVSGLVAQALGWRMVYVIGGLATALLALVLRRALPSHLPQTKLAYRNLLRSVLGLERREPVLRVRSIYGALSFGIFSVFWASAALLLSGSPYHYSSAVIGLFGLVGAGGALGANLAGRLADRGRQRLATLSFMVITLVGFVVLALWYHSLVALVVGVVMMDMGVQGVHISNQSVVFALDPAARSRISGAYMTSFFLGGAVFSAVSSLSYARVGWAGVGAVGIVLATIQLALWFGEPKLTRSNALC